MDQSFARELADEDEQLGTKAFRLDIELTPQGLLDLVERPSMACQLPYPQRRRVHLEYPVRMKVDKDARVA